MTENKLPTDIDFDSNFISVDKEFFYFLLSCLIAQRNVSKMTYENRELTQKAIDAAFSDGVSMLKGIDFIPKCDVLFKRMMLNLSSEYMKNMFNFGN